MIKKKQSCDYGLCLYSMVGDNLTFTLCVLFLLHTGYCFVTTLSLKFIHMIKNAADTAQRILHFHYKDQEGNAVKGHGCVWPNVRQNTLYRQNAVSHYKLVIPCKLCFIVCEISSYAISCLDHITLMLNELNTSMKHW